MQKTLVEQWCKATVKDAVELFHKARTHPDNEAEPLEVLAILCANSAFERVSQTIVGDRNTTAKRYGELCYARFTRLIPQIVSEHEPNDYEC